VDALYTLLNQSLLKVWVTYSHNWPYLLASIIIAVLLKLYLKPEKITSFLLRHQRAGVVGATVAAVATPLCSCGSMAVILGMMASTMPWAPIVAFMVSSPLTSPQELFYSAGLFGWPFAIAFFVSSILLGLLGGVVAGLFESRGWLANQSRFTSKQTNRESIQSVSSQELSPKSCCGDSTSIPHTQSSESSGTLIFSSPASQLVSIAASPSETCCGITPALVTLPDPIPSFTGTAKKQNTKKFQFDGKAFLQESWAVSKKLLVMFFGFAFIGYVLNGLIPSEWVSKIFGSGTIFSVPLAAILGLPLYFNTEASLPLVSTMIENGMSQGAAMAFLITGAGTSIGALGGALTIARWRVVALVIGILITGAILMGYLYNLLIATGWV
jgi:uncharacterized membrane protein YraQ (UPF0718 family)